MTDHISSTPRVPAHAAYFSPFLNVLLAAGIPLAYNRLVTIRGRRTGRPHTTGLAVIPVDGRRWVWAPWGDVHWVRNLRAAGRATITEHGREEDVAATEPDFAGRVDFFRDILGPFARRYPFGPWFIRVVDGVDLDDPVEAADGRSVFELRPLESGPPATGDGLGSGSG